MPFKLDKKKLLIIGGVVLLIIAIIVVVVMTSKPTSKSSASTSQSNNSQNNRTGSPATNTGSPARNTGTGTGTGTTGTTGTGTGTGTGTTGGPLASGTYYLYFPRDNLYLNTQTLAMVPNKSNASVVYWDSNSKILSNRDKSTLTIEGVQLQATTDLPYPGANGPRVALSEYGSSGTLFPAGLSASGQEVLGAGTMYTIQQALYDPSYTFVFQKA